MKLILASKSPRRHFLFRELLSDMDYPVKDFEIVVPNIDESCLDGESPRDCTVRLAKKKAVSILDNEDMKTRRHVGRIILTADTIVVLDGVIYGKPVDEKDAKRMLMELSDKTHEVITGYCVLCIDEMGKQTIINDSDSSLVTFRKLKEKEILAFIKTGIPMDKAGAYAVQEDNHKFIANIQGSYTNVMGLPTEKIAQILKPLNKV